MWIPGYIRRTVWAELGHQGVDLRGGGGPLLYSKGEMSAEYAIGIPPFPNVLRRRLLSGREKYELIIPMPSYGPM